MGTYEFENGTTVQHPENNGEECECVNGYLRCYMVNCTDNEIDCLARGNENVTAVWHEPIGRNCCGECELKPKSDVCQVVKLPDSVIRSGDCVSNKVLEREMCAGKCNTYQTSFIRVFGHDQKIGNKLCKCCGADDTHIEQIEMICSKTFAIFKLHKDLLIYLLFSASFKKEKKNY